MTYHRTEFNCIDESSIPRIYWMLVAFSGPLDFVAVPNKYDGTNSTPACLSADSTMADDEEGEAEEVPAADEENVGSGDSMSLSLRCVLRIHSHARWLPAVATTGFFSWENICT